MPPSLQCFLCKGLIKKACITKCCGTFSACQKCLQRYLVNNKLQCPQPYCNLGNVYVEDLIPNHQLRLIAEWYARQVLISDNMEENEVIRPPQSDNLDTTMLLEKYMAPAEQPP